MINLSSHLEVTGSYFHDAYMYDGTGTKGYGITLNNHSGLCLVSNNIFKHLRHAMMTKTGANGNVFAYNYSIEVYRRRIEPLRNFADFGFYISFFPNLISGPLVKPQEFIPQVRQPFQLSREDFGSAVFLILTGLIKKIIIADKLPKNPSGKILKRELKEKYSAS